MRRSVVIVAAVALAACLNGSDSTAPNEPSDPATETFTGFSPPINVALMTKTSLGDYYKDLKDGTGEVLQGPQTVVFSYVVFLKNGAVIDQQVGLLKDLNTVVRGLQDGMIGMKVGAERLIIVPSANGFGNIAQVGIPANSTLVYDVILGQIP